MIGPVLKLCAQAVSEKWMTTLATPFYKDVVSIRVKLLFRDPSILHRPHRPQWRRLVTIIHDVLDICSRVIAPRSIIGWTLK